MKVSVCLCEPSHSEYAEKPVSEYYNHGDHCDLRAHLLRALPDCQNLSSFLRLWEDKMEVILYLNKKSSISEVERFWPKAGG